ncbi:DUF2490 domain-containing protein [Puteibacter caeruleilacunae]|nr:DUF2490 domain-containing protein [Puteibacter caeruleilacunae]
MRRLTILLVVVVGLLNKAYTQDDDLRLRMGIELEKEVIEDLTLEILPEIRLEHKNQLKESLLESTLTYKMHKYLDVAGGYRLSIEEGEDKTFHRYALDFLPNYKWHSFKVKYRLRYTNYVDREVADSEGSHSWRHRLKLDYKIPKLGITTFVSWEHLRPDGDRKKNRYMGGLKVKLNPYSDVVLYYFQQHKQSKSNYQEILGLTFKIELQGKDKS